MIFEPCDPTHNVSNVNTEPPRLKNKFSQDVANEKASLNDYVNFLKSTGQFTQQKVATYYGTLKNLQAANAMASTGPVYVVGQDKPVVPGSNAGIPACADANELESIGWDPKTGFSNDYNAIMADANNAGNGLSNVGNQKPLDERTSQYSQWYNGLDALKAMGNYTQAGVDSLYNKLDTVKMDDGKNHSKLYYDAMSDVNGQGNGLTNNGNLTLSELNSFKSDLNDMLTKGNISQADLNDKYNQLTYLKEMDQANGGKIYNTAMSMLNDYGNGFSNSGVPEKTDYEGNYNNMLTAVVRDRLRDEASKTQNANVQPLSTEYTRLQYYLDHGYQLGYIDPGTGEPDLLITGPNIMATKEGMEAVAEKNLKTWAKKLKLSDAEIQNLQAHAMNRVLGYTDDELRPFYEGIDDADTMASSPETQKDWQIIRGLISKKQLMYGYWSKQDQEDYNNAITDLKNQGTLSGTAYKNKFGHKLPGFTDSASWLTIDPQINNSFQPFKNSFLSGFTFNGFDQSLKDRAPDDYYKAIHRVENKHIMATGLGGTAGQLPWILLTEAGFGALTEGAEAAEAAQAFRTGARTFRGFATEFKQTYPMLFDATKDMLTSDVFTLLNDLTTKDLKNIPQDLLDNAMQSIIMAPASRFQSKASEAFKSMPEEARAVKLKEELTSEIRKASQDPKLAKAVSDMIHAQEAAPQSDKVSWRTVGEGDDLTVRSADRRYTVRMKDGEYILREGLPGKSTVVGRFKTLEEARAAAERGEAANWIRKDSANGKAYLRSPDGRFGIRLGNDGKFALVEFTPDKGPILRGSYDTVHEAATAASTASQAAPMKISPFEQGIGERETAAAPQAMQAGGMLQTQAETGQMSDFGTAIGENEAAVAEEGAAGITAEPASQVAGKADVQEEYNNEYTSAKDSQEKNYVQLNKAHRDASPTPKGVGPNGGRLQSHHSLQKEWAMENLKQYGYDPELAPSITIETAKGLPHTIISIEQTRRRIARVTSGVGKWSSSLQEELHYLVDDMIKAGFSKKTISDVLTQQYMMLDKLGVKYERVGLK